MQKRATLTLEFNTDVPDDVRDLTLTLRVRDLAAALADLDEDIRSRLKHSGLGPEAQEELESLRQELRDSLGDLAEAVLL
jgi:hypothetical protein